MLYVEMKRKKSENSTQQIYNKKSEKKQHKKYILWQ